MRDESKERSELLLAIQDLGYESLRYSIFNEHRPSEWETRIEYNPELELYEVYSTMDRASKGGIFKFKTFEEAKEKFIHNLKLTVFINKTSVENGEVPEYSSALWDKIEADFENMRCIVEQDIKIGNTVEFNSFEEAKADFINTLENYVEMNIKGKELGFTPEYPSPLWDENGK